MLLTSCADAKQWSVLKDKEGNARPRSRAYHTSWVYGGKLYVYGGKTKEGKELGGLHHFDLGTGTCVPW
jgi:hypothetical protein